jgi:hypothetical protein
VAVIHLGIATIQKIVKKGSIKLFKKSTKNNCHFSAEVKS